MRELEFTKALQYWHTILWHFCRQSSCHLQSCIWIVENDVEVSNPHLFTLLEEAGQVSSPQIEFNAVILGFVPTLAQQLNEFLI